MGRTAHGLQAILLPVRRGFLLVGGLTVVLGFAAGAFSAHRAMLPVRQIAATVRSIIRTGRIPSLLTFGFLPGSLLLMIVGLCLTRRS